MRGKMLFSLAALFGTASASMAVNLVRPADRQLDHFNMVVVPDTQPEVEAPAVIAGTTTSYLCWLGSGTLNSSGALNGVLPVGRNTLNGDDVHMNTTGFLGTVGISVGNTNPDTNGDGITLVQGEVDFFRQSDLSFIDGFLFTFNLSSLSAVGLPGGQSVRGSFPDGTFDYSGIEFDTQDIYMTTTFTTVNMALGLDDPDLVGIQIRNPAGGPAAPGASSQDTMIINGNIVTDPFGTSFDGNTSYFIRVAPIPEPGSLALLGLGALGLIRRRK